MDRLNSKKFHYLDVDGVRTRYFEDGEGKTLIFLHGGSIGFTCSIECWSLNIPDLTKKFRVLAWDKLGQGYTDNPESDAAYTFESVFKHTLGFLKKMEINKAIVVGHSRAGLLATWLALEYPNLVEKLIIVDSNSTAPSDPGFVQTFYDDLNRQIPPGCPVRDKVRMEPEANSFSNTHITENYLDTLADIASLPKSIEAQEKMSQLRDTLWMPSQIKTRDRAISRIEQSGLAMPILLIWGFNDPSAPLSRGLQLFDRVALRTKKAYFSLFSPSGHYPFREHPVYFNHLIESFCIE
jgi:pimeloyl-ACP methyl ester carboxylesterase